MVVVVVVVVVVVGVLVFIMTLSQEPGSEFVVSTSRSARKTRVPWMLQMWCPPRWKVHLDGGALSRLDSDGLCLRIIPFPHMNDKIHLGVITLRDKILGYFF